WDGLAPQVDSALSALPGASLKFDQRLAAVTQANQLLDFGRKLINAYNAFENDVRMPLLSEVPKESGFVSKVMQGVGGRVRDWDREYQRLTKQPKKSTAVKKQLADLEPKLVL